MTTATIEPPRALSDAEISAFHANGWAKLDGLLTPEAARRVLDALTTDIGRTDAPAPQWRPWGAVPRRGAAPPLQAGWHRPHPSGDVPVTHAVAHSSQMGDIGRRLLGVPVRFWSDDAVVALPADPPDDRPAGAWHQDFAVRPLDSSSSAKISIALTEIPTDGGATRYLTGSHRDGIHGKAITVDRDLLDMHPELADAYELSPPLHLRPGDATIHNSLILNCIPYNESSEPRWTWFVKLFAADALYTGARNKIADAVEGLEVDRPLDHPRFPVIG